jgi:hypothetical protein
MRGDCEVMQGCAGRDAVRVDCLARSTLSCGGAFVHTIGLSVAHLGELAANFLPRLPPYAAHDVETPLAAGEEIGDRAYARSP